MRGALCGRAVYRDGATPVAGLRITGFGIRADQPDGVVRPSARTPLRLLTDADGAFFASGLAAGAWLVVAGDARAPAASTTVRVYDDALSDVTLELDEAAPRAEGAAAPDAGWGTGSLRGQVVRDDGSPVADAAILIEAAGPVPDIAPVTNATGDFAMDGLPAGECRVRVRGPAGEQGEATVRIVPRVWAHVVIPVLLRSTWADDGTE